MEQENSMKTQRPRIETTSSKKKYKVGRSSLSDFNLYYKQR